MIHADIERSAETLARIRSLYAHQDRLERCACDGTIRLAGGRMELLPMVMAHHQKSAAHRRWWEGAGW
jgi:hypothetical protein